MWVLFLLAVLGYAVLGLIIVWIGNKVINSIKKDDKKIEKELEEDHNP